MSIAVSIFGMLALSVVLIKSAEVVVSSIRRIAAEVRVPSVLVSAIIIAVATSFPELFIGLASSFSDTSPLSLGNVIGANISNLSLVLGLAGVFGGTLYIRDTKFFNREWIFSFLLGFSPMLLLWDRGLSRIDGVILLSLYAIYLFLLFHQKVRTSREQPLDLHRFLRSINDHRGPFVHSLARFFAGLIVLLLAAHWLVGLSSDLAGVLGVPIFVVGLLIVSVGTTLPEVAFSYRSIRDGVPGLVVGNLLGTLAFNSTFILGVVAIVNPITILHRRSYLIALAAYLLTGFLFWVFARSKYRLSRWEAFLLLVLYVVFFVVQFNLNF